MNCNSESGANLTPNRAKQRRYIVHRGPGAAIAAALILIALAFTTACSQPKTEEATPTLPPLQTATATAILPTATVVPSPKPATQTPSESPVTKPGDIPTATPGPPEFIAVATAMTTEPSDPDRTVSPRVDDSPLNPVPIPTRVIATGPVDRIAIAAIDGSIYTVNPDGTERKDVSRRNADLEGSAFAGAYTWPVWSPDGGSILFSAIRPFRPDARISIMRGPADGNGVGVTLFVDHPETMGIGNGVPHYAMWSPDGSQIAVIAGTGEQLITATFDSETGEERYMVAKGSPVYLDWGPLSSSLVIHVAGSLFTVDHDGEDMEPLFDGQEMRFLAPQFAGGSDRFLHGDSASGNFMILSSGLSDDDTRVLGTSEGVAAFRASPNGETVALLRGEFSGLYDSLALVSLEDGEEELLIERKIRSAWWSPDGSKIAVASLSARLRGGIEWSVWDVAAGEESFAALMVPTPEFNFVHSFFEQYGNSTRLWSPDSTRIVTAGVVVTNAVDPALDLPFQLPEATREEVWVIDTGGIDPPTAIGDGYLGFWSPK